jgi:hypothetical protein
MVRCGKCWISFDADDGTELAKHGTAGNLRLKRDETVRSTSIGREPRCLIA